MYVSILIVFNASAAPIQDLQVRTDLFPGVLGELWKEYSELQRKEFPVQPWNSPRKTKGIVDAAHPAVQKVISRVRLCRNLADGL